MPMPSDRNRDPSLIYVWLAIIAIILMQILSKRVEPVFRNLEKEMALQDLEAEFDGIQHPEKTTPLARQKAAGLFTETSQACDFFIGEIRSYTGEKDQIVNWYADQKVGEGEIGLTFIENREIPASDQAHLPNTLTSLSQWEVDPAQGNQPLYIVYILLYGQDAKNKIECQ